jgi:hypothetical protein
MKRSAQRPSRSMASAPAPGRARAEGVAPAQPRRVVPSSRRCENAIGSESRPHSADNVPAGRLRARRPGKGADTASGSSNSTQTPRTARTHSPSGGVRADRQQAQIEVASQLANLLERRAHREVAVLRGVVVLPLAFLGDGAVASVAVRTLASVWVHPNAQADSNGRTGRATDPGAHRGDASASPAASGTAAVVGSSWREAIGQGSAVRPVSTEGRLVGRSGDAAGAAYNYKAPPSRQRAPPTVGPRIRWFVARARYGALRFVDHGKSRAAAPDALPGFGEGMRCAL